MSFGTLCIIYENHNLFYQHVLTVTQFSYLLHEGAPTKRVDLTDKFT